MPSTAQKAILKQHTLGSATDKRKSSDLDSHEAAYDSKALHNMNGSSSAQTWRPHAGGVGGGYQGFPSASGSTPASAAAGPSSHHYLNSSTPTGSDPGVGSSSDHQNANANNAHKRKKPRVALSCAQCTKRKQKCNRETPCQHCTYRRIPELCTPYVPGEPLPPSVRMPSRAKKSASASASGARKGSTASGAGTAPAAATAASASTSAGESATSVTRGSSVGRDRDRERAGGESPTMTDQDATMSPTQSHYSIGMNEYTFEEDVVRRLNRLEDVVIHGQKPYALDDGGEGYGAQPGIAGGISGGGGELPTTLITPPNGISQGDRDVKISGGIGQSRGTSSGAEGGTGTLDSDRWFATDGTVPAIETLRGTNATIKLDLSDCGTPSENLQRLIKDCGVSPLKLLELVQELPAYDFAKSLVDWFFKQINHTKYPIHETGFRTVFEDMYKKKGEGGPEPGNVRSLPLIFIVLAISVRLAPEEWAGDDRTRKLSSLRMYWCSRRSILIATAIQPESLELVVTRLLSAIYLIIIHDRRLTESWSQLGASLRTAQAIGLHRDGSKLGLDPLQTEYRRRLWSYLYHADVYYSLILGRPPSIADAYCDAREPANVELSDIKPGEPIVSRPLHEPTTATYNILRKRFAKIIGKITFHFQKLHEPATFEDVEALDKEIRQFRDELPPPLRLENPDTSLDEELEFLPTHRYNLATEILFVTITLHRPWLLRKLKSDKFALSRRACFESAKLDFRIRKEFKSKYPARHNMYQAGQFRAFNTAMIAGISAIMAPHNEDSAEMRAIMAEFLDEHPIDKQMKKDHMTQKETAIIYTLYRRALSVFEGDDVNASGHPRESVEVLLGLREGDSALNAASSQVPSDSALNPTNATFPAYAGGSSAVSLFKNLYSTLVDTKPLMDTSQPSAPFQPLSLSGETSQHKRNGSQGHSSGGGSRRRLDESPLSSNSHEDDNPQRLLDQWLSANNAMAVGHMGGAQDGFLLSDGGLGFDTGLDEFGMLDGGGWVGTRTSQNPNAGAAAALDMTGTLRTGHQVPQQDTFHGISDRMARAASSQPQAEPTVPPPNEPPSHGAADPGFSLDDTYWNTLIDGILNST